MSVLPDHRIRKAVADGSLGIEPFTEKQLQPASYDLTLDHYFRTIPQNASMTQFTGLGPIDVRQEKDYETQEHDQEHLGYFRLRGVQHNFALASTIEKIRMPSHIVARVEGKSSLARLGLFVHVTAGFIDPGFEGHITLELFCAHPRGITLYAGMPIAQISFERMESSADVPYNVRSGAKYRGQKRGPTPSAYWKNFVS